MYLFILVEWQTSCNCAREREGRGGMWREGDDLEMGMGCGEERWREEGRFSTDGQMQFLFPALSAPFLLFLRAVLFI